MHRQQRAQDARLGGRISQPAVCDAHQQWQQRCREPGQCRLRLRVTEPDVALQEHGALVGQHQAREQDAPERRAAARQLGQDRPVDGVQDAPDIRIAGLVHGRDGAHATRVGAAVIVAQTLVVAGCRQGQDRALVAERDDAHLAALEHLFQHDAPTCLTKGSLHQTVPDGALRGDHVTTDRDPLARGQPVRLDHHPALTDTREVEGCIDIIERGTHRDGHPGGLRDLPAERLAALQACRRRTRTDHTHTHGRGACPRDPRPGAPPAR